MKSKKLALTLAKRPKHQTSEPEQWLWVRFGLSGSKWVQVGPSGSKWVQVGPSGSFGFWTTWLWWKLSGISIIARGRSTLALQQQGAQEGFFLLKSGAKLLGSKNLGVEAPVGHMMYAAPRNARFVLEVDTKRCFVRQVADPTLDDWSENGQSAEVGKDLGPAKRKFTAILPGQAPKVAELNTFTFGNGGPNCEAKAPSMLRASTASPKRTSRPGSKGREQRPETE